MSLVVLPGTVLSKEGVAILLGLEQKCGEEGRSVIYLPMSDGGIRGPGPFQAPDSSFTFSVKRRMLLLHWMSFKTSTGLQAQPASYSGTSPDSLEGFRGSLMADVSGYITCQVILFTFCLLSLSILFPG